MILFGCTQNVVTVTSNRQWNPPMSTLKFIAETPQDMPLVLSGTVNIFDLHNGNLLCVGKSLDISRDQGGDQDRRWIET